MYNVVHAVLNPTGRPLSPDLDVKALVRESITAVALAKTRWTTGELLGTDFPESRWAVPDILPVGLTFLAGRPKLGKSWLALQLAVAVGTGGAVLGRSVTQGSVAYYALEDSARRLALRLKAQAAPAGADITFFTTCRPFGDGGFVDLEAELQCRDYRLCVIDTFSRAAGRADQSDPAAMTAMLGELQSLAMKQDTALLLIDHHRKSAGGLECNPVDDILSSTAKAAVADCAMGLYRDKTGVVLKLIGRDMEERALALRWDALSSQWQCLGDAEQVQRDSLRGAVLTAIEELTSAGQAATTRRIALHLDKDDGNISRTLAELIHDGKIKRGAKRGRDVPYVRNESLTTACLKNDNNNNLLRERIIDHGLLEE
jgi:hypothetical protein